MEGGGGTLDLGNIKLGLRLKRQVEAHEQATSNTSPTAGYKSWVCRIC